MKLATLAFIAATVAIPAAAFADSSQPMSAPGADAPAKQMQNQGSGREMNRTGSSTGQSGATGPMTTGAANRDSTNTPAGDPLKKSMDDPKQYGHPDKH